MDSCFIYSFLILMGIFIAYKSKGKAKNMYANIIPKSYKKNILLLKYLKNAKPKKLYNINKGLQSLNQFLFIFNMFLLQ